MGDGESSGRKGGTSSRVALVNWWDTAEHLRAKRGGLK